LDDQAKTYNQTCSNESGKILQNRIRQNPSKSILAKLGKRPDQTYSSESAKIPQNRFWQSLENIFQQHKNTDTAFLIIRRSTIGHRQQTSGESGEN
jgi:hypothetical protein